MKICLLIFFFLLSACTHYRETGETSLVSGQCESVFYKSRLSNNEIIWRNVAGPGKVGASYLITGLSYSTNFIVSFTGGVVSSVALCSPFIALDALVAISNNSGSQNLGISSQCIGEVGFSAAEKINPKLGPKSEKATHKWHCPELDAIALGLLGVSQCYENKGEHKLAQEQLENIQSSEVFQKCLSHYLKKKLGMIP